MPLEARVIRQGIRAVLALENRAVSGALTVCFVNDALMTDLNRRYLKKDCPTDVLAFDLGTKSKKSLTGDIVICVDEAARNARIYRTTTEHELKLYAAHGLLHLLGYDDTSSRETSIMRRKEKAYIGCFK